MKAKHLISNKRQETARRDVRPCLFRNESRSLSKDSFASSSTLYPVFAVHLLGLLIAMLKLARNESLRRHTRAAVLCAYLLCTALHKCAVM